MKRVSCATKELSFGPARLRREGNELTIQLTYRGAYGMGEKYDSLNQKGRTDVYKRQSVDIVLSLQVYGPGKVGPAGIVMKDAVGIDGGFYLLRGSGQEIVL